MNPKILLFYHFCHPDDVVSACHYTDLCEGLAARGYTESNKISEKWAEPNSDAIAGSGIPARHTQGTLLGLRASEKWESLAPLSPLPMGLST